MNVLANNDCNSLLYQRSRFIQGELPRDDLDKPYELQESDSMNLSYENSGNSALLRDTIPTLMADAYQKGKTWLLNRMTMPAELSKLESCESMRVCFDD